MTDPSDTNESTELLAADPNAELPAANEAPERISLAVRLAVLVAIMIPLLGVMTTPFIVWGWGFRWTDLGLLLSLYVLTALGITVGYHRLFVHRSFETNIVVKFVLAILGSIRPGTALDVGRHAPTTPPARRHGGGPAFAPRP
jgi:stearoyl-CoA desaturase (delta-9 desaturase)